MLISAVGIGRTRGSAVTTRRPISAAADARKTKVDGAVIGRRD